MNIFSPEFAHEHEKMKRIAQEREMWSIEDQVLLFASQNPTKAREVVQHLASVNWEQVLVRQKEQLKEQEAREQRELQKMIAKGGGRCNFCKTQVTFLYTWTCTNGLSQGRVGERYCLRCLRTFERQAEIHHSEWLIVCDYDDCQTALPFKLMHTDKRLDKLIGDNHGHHYCSVCFPKIVERKSITCAGCGKRTLDCAYQSVYSVCNDCYIKYPDRATVFAHLTRAKSAGTPATLTLVEWEATVKHFDGKCAYCGKKKYKVLEHYLPISLRGGTTASNCVPSCSRCNSKKGELPPHMFDDIFPPENLRRVRSWLAQQQIQEAS